MKRVFICEYKGNNETVRTIANILSEYNLVRMVFSNKRRKSLEYNRAMMRPVLIKGEVHIQSEYTFEKKVTHVNLRMNDVYAEIERLVENDFKQVNLFLLEGEMQILCSKTERPKATKLKVHDSVNDKVKSEDIKGNKYSKEGAATNIKGDAQAENGDAQAGNGNAQARNGDAQAGNGNSDDLQINAVRSAVKNSGNDIVPYINKDKFGSSKINLGKSETLKNNDNGFGQSENNNNGFGQSEKNDNGFGQSEKNNNGFGQLEKNNNGFGHAEMNDGGSGLSKIKSGGFGFAEINLDNNRTKNRIIPDGTKCDFLIRLGVMGEDGKVYQRSYSKFRQINRYLEIVEDSYPVLEQSCEGRAIKIIDFGCGKAYLTFALYYYMKVIKGRDVEIIGLDLKKDVIEFCNSVAKDLRYDGLTFLMGDIADYTNDNCDMVVTLHACDTATDFALINAVNWGTKIIITVPCCQHELFKQIKNELHDPMLKHGILKDRLTEYLTDGLRALKLEAKGYDVSMIEFTSLEHTARNIMIKAVKARPNKKRMEKAESEYQALCDFYHVHPTINHL